jgi:serine protease DegQ
MRKAWLLFSQTVTIAVALLFVVATLKPGWLKRDGETVAAAAPASAAVVTLPAPVRSVALIGAGTAATSYADAAKRASPAVVSITASRTARRIDPALGMFFGRPRQERQIGLGSGVIVSPEGYLLTNNHVIAGADDIEVELGDGRNARAKTIGSDPESDIAVLRIELDKLPTLAFGDVEHLQVGDVVLAIGNPFGVGQTVTSGIVSALGRSGVGINTFENFIQTDAAINPGNSGGALVDVAGNLLGINTAIYSQSGGNLGIGFAIPVSTARQVMESLIKEGRVTRGWIGVEPRDLTPEIAKALLPAEEERRVLLLERGQPAVGGTGHRLRPRPGAVRGRQDPRGRDVAAGRRHEQLCRRPGQAQRTGQQHRGVLVRGVVDASLQVADRPRGHPRRRRQLLLGQLRPGPQPPQQPGE